MQPRRTASLTLIALIAAIALLSSPAPAQPMIDFGRAASEDVLAGDGPRYRSGYSHEAPRRSYRRDRSDERRWNLRPLPRAANRYVHSSRSIAWVRPLPRSTYFRGTGVFANANPSGGSFVTLLPEGYGEWDGRASGPKFIDVASERLDRQPVGPGGISIRYAGSAKIIRIAPDYRMSAGGPSDRDFAALPEKMPATVYYPEQAAPAPPAPAPAPEPSEAWAPVEPQSAEPAAVEVAPAPEESTASTPTLEPWTDEWLRDCVARHDDFDASLGTYIGEDGRRRFCTGDPA